ncbi:MAG: hypothetical protein O7J95_20155, partial [Planctomycetota bacterium]|nr:hypothetical protein [Planctomycetota bacterium]
MKDHHLRPPGTHGTEWLAVGLLPLLLLLLLILLLAPETARGEVPVDLSRYSSDCGVRVSAADGRLTVRWPLAPRGGESGEVLLRLEPGAGAFIERLGLTGRGEERTILRDVDPRFFITEGSRRTPGAKPADQSWRVFFDNPVRRKHETFLLELAPRSVVVISEGKRARVRVEGLGSERFRGALELTFYSGARLVHIEAVVTTREDRRAIFYDAGLVGNDAGWRHLAWVDTEGSTRREALDATAADRVLEVRHRTIVVEAEGGSVACFPPPHQFQFPRDWSTNLGFVWAGRGHRGLEERFGVGVRQAKSGGGPFVPWFNAPPGTEQRLGLFLLIARGGAEEALRETLRYTHGDRFLDIPGHVTMTSHVHMAITVDAMRKKARGVEPLPVPEFVGVFKEMNVDMVHLGEFHGDGHQKDPGPLRLPELQGMFDECRRLSDDELLFIPGEEVNTFLGIRQPGKHPGHWMSLFPRPVYWIMKREEGQPFVESHPRYGKVYRVGSPEDVVRLLDREGGLVWAAHPRIKASSWTPDIFRHESFYLADSWLGGAWKAMPGDLSHDRLGQVTLDLLSDMANWGQRKYLLGEIDLFKIDHTHELYGHMNVNYLRLERLPRFDEGWQPVLDALRGGRFFVTTGEVLIRDFRVGGKQSGETLELGGAAGDRPALAVDLEWTFPLRFAELVSGDGSKVYRERIGLEHTTAFGSTTLTFTPRL